MSTARTTASNKRRDVNAVELSAELELSRFRRQFLFECLSLLVITLAVLFITVTPFLLIPIWVIPNEYSVLIRHFLWVALGLCVLFLILAALLGNVYWFFDPLKNKWRWILHCGRGPVDYYWGDVIFSKDFRGTSSSTHGSSVAEVVVEKAPRPAPPRVHRV